MFQGTGYRDHKATDEISRCTTDGGMLAKKLISNP